MQPVTFTTIEREKFAEFQQRYLRQIAYMDADLKEWTEKQGGVDKLNEKQRAQYAGRENGLIVLANYDDAVMDFVGYLESRITDLAAEVAQLKANAPTAQQEHVTKIDWVRSWSGFSRVPQSLQSLLVFKEAKRRATINAAQQQFNF